MFMKFRRFLSGLIFGFGCAFSFIGLIGVVLPAIDNPQMKLVVSSFNMPSEQMVINAVNRFMQFVFVQNWRVLYLGLLISAMGAMLILRFTPKVANKPEPEERPEPMSVEQPVPAEKLNPYARITYSSPAPDETIHWAHHQEPILARNPIVETEEEPESEVQPYFSPRFSAESRAVETETGAWSQSGSRILIRSTPLSEAELVEEPVPPPPPPLQPVIPSPALSVPPPIQPPSPRIRSTMGRHTRSN